MPRRSRKYPSPTASTAAIAESRTECSRPLEQCCTDGSLLQFQRSHRSLQWLHQSRELLREMLRLRQHVDENLAVLGGIASKPDDESFEDLDVCAHESSTAILRECRMEIRGQNGALFQQVEFPILTVADLTKSELPKKRPFPCYGLKFIVRRS